jgi:hypothetical protein
MSSILKRVAQVKQQENTEHADSMFNHHKTKRYKYGLEAIDKRNKESKMTKNKV